MRNKIQMITGEKYTLSELFYGNRKIVIPDLQRDYCWGDSLHTNENKELVSNFFESLYEQFINNHAESLNLGLIYGYEQPSTHLQLCDGQQRITTLYLIVGMLNRTLDSNQLRSVLISDYEYFSDDKEPYLQYSIRESSLYFLSDLVCEFFITDKKNEGLKVEDIKKQKWYFSEYDHDPSVQSMIRALGVIESKIANVNKTSQFGQYLTSKLTLMYYDMGSRKSGEETFVIINTTGEPLTATENLKPLIVNAKINKENENIACDWEEMETWFWKNRANGNDTADIGLEEFLRWVTLITYSTNGRQDDVNNILSKQSYKFDHEQIPFTRVKELWEVVKKVFGSSVIEPIASNRDMLSPALNKDKKRIITQIDAFVLLPIIAYIDKFSEATKQDIQRIYNLYRNLSRYQSIEVGNSSVFYAINAIDKMDRCDILSFLDSKGVSSHILTAEESLKLKVIAQNLNIREKIEIAFNRAQTKAIVTSHEIWNGEIKPMVEWSMEDEIFDIIKFETYLDVFDNLFVGKCEANIDITRRALLTRGLEHYPIWHGKTCNFGWKYEQWRDIFKNNYNLLKEFFDDIIDGGLDNINDTQKMMCINYTDRTNWWSIFVEENDYLKNCGAKHVQYVNHDIIKLLLWGTSTGVHNFSYLYGWQKVKTTPDWTAWNLHSNYCLYSDHTSSNIAIELLSEVNNSNNERFYLHIFNRNKSEKAMCNLENIAKQFELTLKNDRYESSKMMSIECYELCEQIRTAIDSDITNV